jgi:hypothetical protein
MIKAIAKSMESVELDYVAGDSGLRDGIWFKSRKSGESGLAQQVCIRHLRSVNKYSILACVSSPELRTELWARLIAAGVDGASGIDRIKNLREHPGLIGFKLSMSSFFGEYSSIPINSDNALHVAREIRSSLDRYFCPELTISAFGRYLLNTAPEEFEWRAMGGVRLGTLCVIGARIGLSYEDLLVIQGENSSILGKSDLFAGFLGGKVVEAIWRG